jgi:Fungal Zn(2)-Cys(6) binuclear cluster domain
MASAEGPASGLLQIIASPQQQYKPTEASNTKKRKVIEDATNATTARQDTSVPLPPLPIHTRTMAACDACRVSKTRCDAARPVCAKCLKRGRNCVYPDRDPTSMYVTYGDLARVTLMRWQV